MDITLVATAEEAAFVLRVIGQLPTESNAWPLHQKLKAQFETQAKALQEAKSEDAAVGGTD